MYSNVISYYETDCCLANSNGRRRGLSSIARVYALARKELGFFKKVHCGN